MIDIDGFETWIYFGSKYGCNLNILLYSYVCFSFSNWFCVAYWWGNPYKIQDLVFDFHAHKIDGCYILKGNCMHHKSYILK